LLYVVGGALVLTGRLRFERRQRILRRVETLLSTGTDDARRQAAVVETLLAAPSSLVWALAADSSLAPEVQRPVAAALVRGVGRERIRRTASAGTSWRRVAALRALTLVEGGSAWSLLSLALRDGSATVGGATVTFLGQVNHRYAAELLTDALRSGRLSRSRVATALERFPTAIPEVIAPLLWSEEALVRYWAVTLMRRYPSAPGLYDRLDELARDESPLVRKASLVTLAELGDARGTSVARTCLADGVPFVRAHAARALGALEGLGCASAVGALLSDRDWWVRSAAKQTLESFGPVAAPWVIPFLVHSDRFARNGAAEVLQNTGVYEQLLLEEATGRIDRYRRDVLLLLAQAGGPEMWNIRLAQLPITRARRSEMERPPSPPSP